MRRVYDSGALNRDDGDPFRPNESDERTRPRAARSVPATAVSKALVPQWLARRGISVTVSTPQEAYPVGSAVPIRVELHNAYPIPLTVETTAPVLWHWTIDGHREAVYDPEPYPDESGEFVFDRGERKRFDRRWHGAFQVSPTEWVDAEPGEHVIGAGLAVADPAGAGLHDETTIRLE